MTVRKPCYGTMFPDVVPPVDTDIHKGKAFSFEIKNIGLARGERHVEVLERSRRKDATSAVLELNSSQPN